MTAKGWMSLLGLTFSAFVFNTSEFMPVSLLTDIAAYFAISEAKTGMIISVYAWFVAIFSLPLMIVASRMEMKKLLVCVLLVFAAGQILSAVAPTYYTLMAARLVVASAHSIFWAIATPMAARAVPEKHRALGISMVATGTSIAMIAGLPLGRAIGLAVGWRMTFAIVGAITLAVSIFLAVIFPKMPSRGTFSIKKLPELLKDKLVMSLYLITLIVTVAYYIGYSYMEPTAGMEPQAVTITLSIYGLAGIIASILFSKYYNSRPVTFISASLGGITLSMALLPRGNKQCYGGNHVRFDGFAHNHVQCRVPRPIDKKHAAKVHRRCHVDILRNIQHGHRNRHPYWRSRMHIRLDRLHRLCRRGNLRIRIHLLHDRTPQDITA